MIRYLVTGCGQSGTMYTARLLTAAGLNCSHESVFDRWGDDYDTCPDWQSAAVLGDSSFAAAPFTGRVGKQVVVVHQVRAPLDQIRAVVAQGLLDGDDPPPWVRFIHRHSGILDRPPGPERAAQYWLAWNWLASRWADQVWHVSDIAPRHVHWLANETGLPVTDVAAAFDVVATDTNSKTPDWPAIGLDDLGPCSEPVERAAGLYGVPLTEHEEG